MTGILAVLCAGIYFPPTTHTYTSGTGATETIPVGARNLTIETWGSGGYGGPGSGSGCAAKSGSGGGAGGYSKTTLSVVASVGKTLTYTVGAVPGVGAAGNASSVSSGTLAIATMTANGGAAGAADPSAGGAGGTASGGTAANTTGGAGTSSALGGAGGTAVAGVSGSGVQADSADLALPIPAALRVELVK
jgi:hypothetical protein